MAYYKRRRYRKSNSTTLTEAGNQLAKDNARAKKKIGKGSFF